MIFPSLLDILMFLGAARLKFLRSRVAFLFELAVFELKLGKIIKSFNTLDQKTPKSGY